MEKNFRPLGDRVLVKPDPVEEQTKSGLIIPETVKNKQKPIKGTVISIGPGVKSVDSKSKVLYAEHSGTKIKLQDEEFLVMRESELFGIIEKMA